MSNTGKKMHFVQYKRHVSKGTHLGRWSMLMVSIACLTGYGFQSAQQMQQVYVVLWNQTLDSHLFVVHACNKLLYVTMKNHNSVKI